MSTEFTHLDAEGRPRMVDVGAKPETSRRARAEAFLRFSAGTLARVLSGDLPKGAVLEVARVAGIQAAKRTSELVPLCHPVRISEARVDFEPSGDETLRVVADVRAFDRTGVEMEALCAASIAALTVYDMVKAVDRSMRIDGVRVLLKEGGKSGRYEAGS